MPPQRVRSPPYLAMLLIAVAVVAIMGFQSLREQRASKAMLEDKGTEINNLHKEVEDLSETSEEMRQTISKLHIEKDTLTLDRNSLRKQLIDLEHEKSSTENEKNKLDLSLRGKANEMDDLKLKVNELQEKEDEVNLLKDQVKKLQKKIMFLETNHEGKNSDHGKFTSHLDAGKDKMGQGAENNQSLNMTTTYIESTTAAETLLEKGSKNKLDAKNSAEATKAGQAEGLSHERKLVDKKKVNNKEVEEGSQEKGDDFLDRVDPERLDKDADDNDEEQVADKEDEQDEKEDENEEKEEDEEEISDQQDDVAEDMKQNIEHGDDNERDEERADME